MKCKRCGLGQYVPVMGGWFQCSSNVCRDAIGASDFKLQQDDTFQQLDVANYRFSTHNTKRKRIGYTADQSENVDNCKHESKEYVGLVERYNYCTKCDKRLD